jgi:nucleoside 2-deoxyribosyltransferase
MKIYVSGSIYGGRQKIETYRKIIEALELYGEVCDKQIIDEDVIKKEEFQEDETIFKDLETQLKTADLVFAEVTVPSLGVGYELGFADQLGKRIIAIYDLNEIEKVSTMIRGNKRIELIGYRDISEITDNLDDILNRR